MDRRIPHSLGSVVLLTGAFAVGWAAHVTVVTSQAGLLDPAPVFATLGGVALIALGRRLERQFDPSAFVRGDEEDDEDEESFDEELSPLGEEQLEGLERDEDYDG